MASLSTLWSGGFYLQTGACGEEHRLGYDKLILGADFYCADFGETLIQGWRLELLERVCKSDSRNFALACSLIVSSHRIPQIRREEICDQAKSRRPGGLNIPRAIGGQRIGVVHNERLARLQTRFKQQLFAPPRPQHIQVDANMRFEEAFAVESGLPGTLNANEDDGFGSQSASRDDASRTNLAPRSFGSFGGRGPCRTAVPTGT